ncbi:MAG TPA: DUF4337 family protein [Terriglobales bacterium]
MHPHWRGEEIAHEQVEKARDQQQKGIGLTTAVVAVFLAFATMLANDANTERIVVETKTAHWWAFTDSNDTNSRMYMATERLAQLHGEDAAAQQFHALYAEEKKQSEDARAIAQRFEKESQHETRKGHWFEFAELSLETSIVLCSVALLTELLLFWRVSFVSTGAGLVLIMTGAWFC